MRPRQFLPVMVLLAALTLCMLWRGPHPVRKPLKMDPADYGFRVNVHEPADFEAWRAEVLKFYRKALKISADYEALPLQTKVTEEVAAAPDVKRLRVEYGTTDGLSIPAYLFVPKTDKKVPAVIVYHGHGPGKINAAVNEGTFENALALYLAEGLGYVVLAPDSRTFGEFAVENAASHEDYYYRLLTSGKFYMGKLMEDGYQNLALLRTVPEADMERLGVAGISMGSWNALNFAVLHDEVDATVVSGLYIPWAYLFSRMHCPCQNIRPLAMKMKMEDLAATIFPRDLMVQWGLDDPFHRQGAEGLIDRTEGIADFLGYGKHFVVDRHEMMGHQFSNREIADFFSSSLGEGAWKATFVQ